MSRYPARRLRRQGVESRSPLKKGFWLGISERRLHLNLPRTNRREFLLFAAAFSAARETVAVAAPERLTGCLEELVREVHFPRTAALW